MCYIFGGALAIVAIIFMALNKWGNKGSVNVLKKLEEQGKLEIIKNEYEKYTVEKYPKMNLELTENYIISYIPFLIIAFADVTNVYSTNMVEGVYQTLRYIAVETKDNKKYYIAQKQLNSKNPQFEEALEKIKSKVKQGGR